MKGYCENYSQMSITRVNPEFNTFGYKYLIKDNNTSYKAFKTLQGLRQWLKDCNLRVSFVFRNKTHVAYFKVLGQINSINTFDVEFMESLKPDVHRIDLSNGDYVDYKILHYFCGCLQFHLNPNVKNRKTYEYEKFRDR